MGVCDNTPIINLSLERGQQTKRPVITVTHSLFTVRVGEKSWECNGVRWIYSTAENITYAGKNRKAVKQVGNHDTHICDESLQCLVFSQQYGQSQQCTYSVSGVTLHSYYPRFRHFYCSEF